MWVIFNMHYLKSGNFQFVINNLSEFDHINDGV